MSTVRLAVVVSHPIQHFVHLFRALASRPGLSLHVLFCSRIGLEPTFDAEMNRSIAWSGNLTGGFPHSFLPEAPSIRQAGFHAVDNPSVGAALAAFRPDAVLVFGYAQRTALRALHWCRRHRIPALMTGDGSPQTGRAPWRASLRALLLRPLLARVSAFLTPGDGNERMLGALGVPSARMFRTPFPIDETAFAQARASRAAHRAHLREGLGLASDTPIALFVGKLSPRKRPLDPVEAWRRLPQGIPFHIVFCGEGTERGALEALIRKTGAPATLQGFVNLNALPGLYAGSDMLVHPASFDPHPLAVSEAAAAGLPLLLSERVGAIGPSDVAQPGRNTLVHPCGDTNALAANLTRLLGDPQLHARLARASLEIAAECGMAQSVAGVERALGAVLRARA